MAYTGPEETKYLFIDGGFLRETGKKFSKHFLEGQPIELQYPRIKGVNTKVFYYDALPKRRQSETDAEFANRLSTQKAVFAEIQSQDYFHAEVGAIDGNFIEGVAQKGVDVRLAIDALLHSLRGNTRNVTIFTSDSDFIPLLRALVQNGVNVTLMYDPQKANEFLVRSADIHTPITASLFKSYLAPGQQKDFEAGLGQESFTNIKYNRIERKDLKTIIVGRDRFSFFQKRDMYFCEHSSIESRKSLSMKYAKNLQKLQRLLEWDFGLKINELDF